MDKSEPALRRRPGFSHSRFVASFDAVVMRPAWKLVSELQTFEWASPERIREIQWERARALLAHAVETVPYYGRLFARNGLEAGLITPDTFHRIPPLTKDALRQSFPDDITSRALPRPAQAFSTSGSTGLPLQVYRDPTALTLSQAIRRWHYGWAGLEPGDLIAHVKFLPGVSWPTYPIWAALSQGRHYTLKDERLRDHRRLARTLNRWRPAAVYGYPSSLAETARLLREGGHALSFTPRALFSGAATLTPDVERLVTETFGAPVHNRYGAVEFGTWVAQSCPERVGRGETAITNLHVNAWRFLVEVVDEAGRPVPDGREGRLLVTDLYNRVMPLIRYEIGDEGELAAETCSCGRGLPLLKRLLGRSSAKITLPSGRTYSEWLLYCVIENETHALRAYQFVQEARDRLVLRIVPVSGALDRALAAKLEGLLLKGLPEPMRVTVEAVDAIPPDHSGKRSILKVMLDAEATAVGVRAGAPRPL